MESQSTASPAGTALCGRRSGAGSPGRSAPRSGFLASADALAVYNGELIAGGGFGFAGGVPVAEASRAGTGSRGNRWDPGSRRERCRPSRHSAATSSPRLPSAVHRWNGAVLVFHGGRLFGVPEAFATWGGALFLGGSMLSVGAVGSPYLARWSSPLPILALSQPFGPGTGVQVANHWLIPGHEYYNLASPTPCASGPGTGPYGGLCFANVADLVRQLTLPVGTAPFHFVAGSPDATFFGPFPLPPGLAIEALSVDVTGGTLGCLSPVVSYVVN